MRAQTVIGPRRGFLYSANHRPIGSFYGIPIGLSTGGGGHTIRSWRLDELLTGGDAFAPEDVLAVHFDAVNPARRQIVRLGYHLRDVQGAGLSDGAVQALAHLEAWEEAGASSDLSQPGAALATRINLLFRAGNTDLANEFGGGQSGLVRFLHSTAQRLRRDPTGQLERAELAYVDRTLSDAWTLAGRQLASAAVLPPRNTFRKMEGPPLAQGAFRSFWSAYRRYAR